MQSKETKFIRWLTPYPGQNYVKLTLDEADQIQQYIGALIAAGAETSEECEGA